MAETALSACVIDTARADECRNSHVAAHLKLIAIFVIFFTSAIGISLPVILARLFRGRSVYDRAIHVIKCFAAGVILSTALVHVLPDAFAALADCHVASRRPWKNFPFAGLVTLIGSLLALLVDVTATSHLHGGGGGGGAMNPPPYVQIGAGMKSGELGFQSEKEIDEIDLTRMKQRLVSQVLEIGIIFHSVIIGVSMGMSQNQCTIKPLIAALAFHQIFEGMGLGGCIAQAGFGMGTMAYMSFMFSVTTPIGIVLGMIVYWGTGYDDNSLSALISEGLLGSISSGVLIYMALVDLISVDFFHNKITNSTPWLRKASYIALVLGSAIMSLLAIWA